VIGFDCGLGVLKTCRRDAVAGTEGKETLVPEICVTAPRMSAGCGAESGLTVIAATAANESTLPQVESSTTFIRENWPISQSKSTAGRRTDVCIGVRGHSGTPKLVLPLRDGKGSYEHNGGYDDGKACSGAGESSALPKLSVIGDCDT